MTFVTEVLSDENKWQAIKNRDLEAKHFYYAVKTTGIYCRPGCVSRIPNRENILYFNTVEEAENAGYRKCKRCLVHKAALTANNEERIIRACRLLEKADRNIKLEDLAAEMGLSPHYFHRLFKKHVGITPKQYAKSFQTRRFKKSLKENSSVTHAIYEAGFGSSSRVYERKNDRLAMNPKSYKAGGGGQVIQYGIAKCFLGYVIVGVTARGICAIEFGDKPTELPNLLQSSFPGAELQRAEQDLSSLIEKAVGLVESPGENIELPLDIQGTAFQERVWSLLREIQPGTTQSYNDIAEKMGIPDRVEDVAKACSANRIAVAIPCHRVGPKAEKSSGYPWGNNRQKVLLEKERGSK